MVTDKEWQDSMQALADSCGGVFSVEYTLFPDVPLFRLRAVADPLVAQHAKVMIGVILQIADDAERVDCLACGDLLVKGTKIGAMLTLVPMAEKPANGIGGAVCAKCSARYVTTDLWHTMVAERFGSLFANGARIAGGFIVPGDRDGA